MFLLSIELNKVRCGPQKATVRVKTDWLVVNASP